MNITDEDIYSLTHGCGVITTNGVRVSTEHEVALAKMVEKLQRQLAEAQTECSVRNDEVSGLCGQLGELTRQLAEARVREDWAIGSRLDMEQKLHTAEQSLIDERSRSNDYRLENIRLQAEIARMKPVVEAMGNFNKAYNTNYKDMHTTIFERGTAMKALQTAYLEYEQSAPKQP